ncbi:hypothetical protein D9758_003401 [Tetrapyrgos nigripes]|uniref:Heterokaryon incompatibility domain-containing protein n=1 Tax=Tetrapyrgos nigripes TaxID=182062 RepID=A0A8H5GUN2_9AGAR|nr:hypothetical protein D9758_003401 [Tetrapyrgos nigripes]
MDANLNNNRAHVSMNYCFRTAKAAGLIDVHTRKLKDFTEDDTIPPYVILSHRWVHDEEVNYRDFLELLSKTKKKSGYRKIKGACKQASLDGHHFIWIDTCCLDQDDSDDVARNINSMYSYYRNSTVCYTYLSDVYTPKYGFSKAGAWSDSGWFGRGWTLQELLAPRKVVFFNARWEFVGDKDQLKFPISRLTGIPSSVLDGSSSMEDIDLQERMAWCAGRRTTKPPDLAYCLLGILGVSMTPDYTEDARTALQRLQKVLVQSYPDRFLEFRGDDIYAMLLRKNARSWIGTGSDSSPSPENNAVVSYSSPNDYDSISLLHPDSKHFVTTTCSVEVGPFVQEPVILVDLRHKLALAGLGPE